MRLRRSVLTLMHTLVFLMGTDAMTRQSHAGTCPVEYKMTTVAGALAFAHEVQAAKMHLLNAGHFALDEEVEMVAMLMQRFLARRR